VETKAINWKTVATF